MKITKLMVMAAAVAALGAAALGVREFRAAGVVAEARVAANGRSEETRAKIADLEKKLATEAKRAVAVENDNVTLARAVKTAQAALAKPAAVAITREGFTERLKQAVALEKEGDPETARRELLWCYDTAVAQPALVAGGQMISIMSALVKLSERQPAVLMDLRERFEAGKRRVLSGDDTEPLAAMSAIARALKDEQAMVAVLDGLPAGDARRVKVSIYAMDGLVADRKRSTWT